MDEYRLDTGRIWSRQLGVKARPENTAYRFDPGGYQGAIFWYLWPNTTFNILPGPNEMAVYAIRPIDHEWSSFEGHLLTADGGINDARATYTADVLGRRTSRCARACSED